MAKHNIPGIALFLTGAAWILLFSTPSRADDSETKRQLLQLQQENEQFRNQLRQQQTLIESLTRKVGEIQDNATSRNREFEKLEAEMKETAPAPRNTAAATLGKVSLSGEGGVGFFNTGRQGMFPQSSFRVDEARLFVEAPVFENVYAYSEINLATRESSSIAVELGEAYVDFENVSQLWHRDRMLNIRVGRMYIPFGEEYLTRHAIDNPLISHSLTDFWGVDEGIEFYGTIGKFNYVLALQNGGVDDTQDFDNDKSLAGRLCYDPARWLHLSVSAMRTGELNSRNDFLSALWFGNAFFRSLGSSSATQFHANLAEADVTFNIPHGHVTLFGGYIRYDDNDPTANNGRDVYYYTVEAVHDLTGKLYAGARFSQIFAHKGFPIVADGQWNDNFFGALTQEIWRLSLGLGYRFSRNLVLKAEYSFEQGRVVSGPPRNHEDLFAVEAAFRF